MCVGTETVVVPAKIADWLSFTAPTTVSTCISSSGGRTRSVELGLELAHRSDEAIYLLLKGVVIGCGYAWRRRRLRYWGGCGDLGDMNVHNLVR